VDAVHADGATALLSSHVITDIEQACDHMLVLGGGRMLLDLSIAEAISEHRVIDGDMTAEAAEDASEPGIGLILIGVFPGPANERLSLVRAADGRGRPATLEEVVLGHLAAARIPTVPGAGRERAA